MHIINQVTQETEMQQITLGDFNLQFVIGQFANSIFIRMIILS